MKLATILLTLLFLGLTMLPCEDTDVSNESDRSVTQTSDPHDHQQDNCSPFCVCNCCHTHFMSINIFEKETSTKPANDIDFFYLELKPEETHSPHFQPPKS